MFGKKNKDKGKCTKCRFNIDLLTCSVGTHYAELKLNRHCWEGELWEAILPKDYTREVTHEKNHYTFKNTPEGMLVHLNDVELGVIIDFEMGEKTSDNELIVLAIEDLIELY